MASPCSPSCHKLTDLLQPPLTTQVSSSQGPEVSSVLHLGKEGHRLLLSHNIYPSLGLNLSTLPPEPVPRQWDVSAGSDGAEPTVLTTHPYCPTLAQGLCQCSQKLMQMAQELLIQVALSGIPKLT
jgi:hypothetical protein